MRLATGWGDGKIMGDLFSFSICQTHVESSRCPPAAVYLIVIAACRSAQTELPWTLMVLRSSRWLYVMQRFHQEPLWWDVEMECWVPPPHPGSLPQPTGHWTLLEANMPAQLAAPFSAQCGAGRSGPFCPPVRSTWPVSLASRGHVP